MNIKIKKIQDLIDTIFLAQGFLVSYSLGLFHILNDKDMSVEELCQDLSLQKRPLQALLSICLSLGLLTIIKNKYSLSEDTKQNLMIGKKNYYSDVLNLLIKNNEIFNFDTIRKAILKNKSQIYQENAIFEKNKTNQELTKDFIKSMHNKSYFPASIIVDYMDLNKHKILLDIGGGSGIFAINICKRFLNMKGIVFDMPIVCKMSQNYINENNMSNRVTTYSGDMWTDHFPIADIHFFSDILHDWSYESNLLLLKKSYQSLPTGGQIILNEKLFNDKKTGPLEVAVYNIKMLLWTEGQQYSYSEIKNMLNIVGFKKVKRKKYLDEWTVIAALK